MASRTIFQGQKYHRLTVTGEPRYEMKPKYKVAIYPCVCQCGKSVNVRGDHLKSGNTKSCGCYRDEWVIQDGMRRRKIVSESTRAKIGQRFSRLVVLGKPFWIRSEQKSRRSRNLMVVCKCDCGTVILTHVNSLCSKNCESCGCLRDERRGKATITHGMTRTPLYRVWSNMRRRCNSPSDASYDDYGGRGIQVCEKWNTSFFAFQKWSELNGHKIGLVIDRIDVNGDYCPENCRFVTHKESGRNRRDNHLVEAFGETKCLAEWVDDDRCSVSYHTLRSRLKRKWKSEKAISFPLGASIADDD